MSKKPNVIVFFTDQQRWDTCGLHGNPLGLTPNYDRIAQRGAHARYAFTCQPVCGPARSCIQTGLYATSSGCYRNGIALPSDTTTLAEEFKKGGYATGYIGKWHLGPPNSKGPVVPHGRGGYEYWLAANALEAVSDAYDCRVFDDDGQEVRLPGYRVDALTDAAIRYVDDRSKAEQPYFLFLSFLEPHHQNHRDDYPAPDGYESRYAGRWTPPDLAALGGTSQRHLGGYYGMVKRLDEALGRLLDALASLGELDNTIIAFTSDHGCHFKTRNQEYKRTCHESSIRVPMAFSGPGFDGAGDIAQLVSLIDLPPTLLDAANLPVPPEMQGHSLLPLLRNRQTDWPDDVFIQTSEHELGRSLRTSRWKYGVLDREADPATQAASNTYQEAYLYDLKADPWELNNLVGYDSHQSLSAKLRSRLVARMIAIGENEPTITPAPIRPSGQLSISPEEESL